MQIKISLAAAYDFNQYTKYVPRHADFDPFPAPPRTVGRGITSARSTVIAAEVAVSVREGFK